MKNFHAKAASTMIIISGAIAIGAEPGTEEIISDMADTISQNYVFPEMGKQVSEMLLGNLADGEYDGLDRPRLAELLSTEIRDLTHDLHFGVRALPDDWQPPSDDDDPGLMGAPRAPYGFNTVQRLNGNIGYIDLRGFDQARYVDETAEAAMLLLQGSSSIIFDLRKNGGGDPETVQLISSYLFDPAESVHLNSLYSRPNDHTTEYWTHANISTTLAMPDVPVYVLTSRHTFSAAEEFTYNLKHLKRATIVGETTGGGAHPVDSLLFDNQFVAIVPTARAINPISGTNWEGTGVEPDIKVNAEDALDVAMDQALAAALKGGDESVRWGLATIRANTKPISLSTEELAQYAGDYGSRHTRVHDGSLEYRREGVSDWIMLLCFEHDRFVIKDFEGFIMEFTRDANGEIDGITGHYEQGQVDRSPRD